MLSKEQSEQIKKQLLQNLDKFPEDKRDFIKNKLTSLSEKELEDFLFQNKLVQGNKQQQNIFTSIISGQIPSYKINENENNIAILEINPISKGHSLIIPKKQTTIEELPSDSFLLAKEIAKKIKSEYNPKEIKITANIIMDYALIEIIPFYEDTTGKKEKIPKEELEKIQKDLEEHKPEEKPKEEIEQEELIKIKPRIP